MKSDNNYAQVLYDFVGNFADELTVKTGEIVQILYEIDEDWVYVKSLMIPLDQSGANGGIIPKNHLKQFQIPLSFSNRQFNLFVAIDNFGEQNNDLYFLKNDLIISKDNIDENWLYGYLIYDENKSGMFPISFVKQVYLTETNNNKNNTYENIFEPKQAKALYSFESTESNHLMNHSYLKFEKNEYLLITDRLDQNWLIGEKLNGDKGLIPINYIEYLAQPEPVVLNKTQKFFKDINQVPPQTQIETINSYCLVNFDFQPENENELGCLKGEQLKIIKTTNNNNHSNDDEWIQVENKYGKKGMIPFSFITILTDIKDLNNSIPSITDLNLRKRTNKTSELSSINNDSIKSNRQITEIIDNSLEASKRFRNLNNEHVSRTSKIFEEKINQNKNELEQSKLFLKKKDLNGHRPPPDIPAGGGGGGGGGSVIRKSIIKPPIPPKPILSHRPVVYNNELLSKIKHLESIIQKQNENIETTITPTKEGVLIEVDKKIDENNSSLECLRNDLSNMKNLFVESAQSRQLALAQIDIKEEEEQQQQPDETEIMQQINETTKLKKKQTERELTINELFETELIYLNELTAFYDAFITNCLEYPIGFNRNILFDELKNVIRFSNQLVFRFEHELKLNNYNNIRIGLILINTAEEIKDVYARYMQNHANITNLIKNYESNPEISQFINNRLNTLKDQVKVLNLQSLLIKPVQRIFKYPLFLKRIQENTETTHCDYDNLNKSILVFTKALEYINEYKRRRDLVNKYKQSTQIDYADLTIGDIFKKITLKSIAKKTSRLSIQLTSKLGLFDQQVFDENFKRQEANFRFVETVSRQFVRDLNEYLTTLREVINNDSTIYNHLLYIFDDEFQTFLQFDTAANERFKITFKNYYQSLKNSIDTSGLKLIDFFVVPNKLIDKRNDKLVDYEGVLSDYKSTNTTISLTKEMSNRLNETKKNYEALNDQLIEELPKLTRISSRILILFVKKFLILTHDFNLKIKKDFNSQKSILKFTTTTPPLPPPLLQTRSNNNYRHSSQLYNLEALHKQSRQSSILIDLIEDEESKQTEQHVCNLKHNYSSENLFKVCKEYKANEKLRQISLKPGDLVGLIKSFDPSGNDNIWFVDSGKEKGFIPFDVLEPMSHCHHNNIENLINFDEIDESSKNNLNENPFMLNVFDEYCMAMFDFKAIKNNMIDLTEGKIYKIKEKCDKKLDPEWWLVESSENKIGYVPQCYVKLLD